MKTDLATAGFNLIVALSAPTRGGRSSPFPFRAPSVVVNFCPRARAESPVDGVGFGRRAVFAGALTG